MSEYQRMKENYIKGWNTWNTRSVLSHVLMPEAFAINLCIKDYKNSRYLREAFIGQHGKQDEQIHPGVHAYDGSYTELNLKWMGMEFEVQSGTEGEDLVILITPIVNRAYPPTLVVESGMLWNHPGSIALEDGTLTADLPGRKVTVYTTKPLMFETNVPAMTPYLAMRLDEPIGVSTGRSRTVEEIKEILRINKERHEAGSKKYGKLAEAYNAMQTCLAWDTIYEPEKDRDVSTVSRLGNMGWSGYVMFCWDNYFAAYIASLDNKELAYSNAIEMTREKTENGFVPNYAAALEIKSRDRSQPPVGSMVIRELYRKYGEKWLLEEVFDDLFVWNTWFIQNREAGNGVLAWGSNPYEPVVGHNSEMNGVNDRLGAALESGLDNSPMYDDMPFDTEKHQMMLADVGLTGLYIMDCRALSDIADVLGRHVEAEELRKREARCSEGLKALWEERSGIFMNKRTDTGEFSPRLSPTNFYALFSDAVADEQAERMINEHFYNPEEFWGEWIMPSIARNDPGYKDQNYWRGRIWAPMNFLAYLAMRRHKLTKACGDLAEKSVNLIMKEWLESGHVHENYNSDTGEGCDSLHSDRFYHWGGLLSMVALIDAGYVEGPEKSLKQS